MFPPFLEMPFTYTICLLVTISSTIGFYHKRYYHALIYHPYEVFRGKRLHTLFTSAFVHKKWWHLFFNLYIFYRVNRDIEYIIMEDDFSFSIIVLICILLVIIGVVLPNLIDGLKHKNNISYTSVGFSGAVFCSAGFCGLYLPLDELLKRHLLFPFLHHYYEVAFFGLAVFFTMALVFKNSKTANHRLHFNALAIGCLLAVVLRPKLILEIIVHIKDRLD